MKVPFAVGEPSFPYRSPVPSKFCTRQDYEYPDGSKKDFYLWGPSIFSVLVFAITENGNVLVIRQWRPGAGGVIKEVAGGHRKKKPQVEGLQDPIEALIDELREETGYRAAAIVPLSDIWAEPASEQAGFNCFLALDCKKVGDPEPEFEEILEPCEMSMDDWLDFCSSPATGKEKDGKTLAITLLALRHMGRI